MNRIFIPPLAPKHISAEIDPILRADDLQILKSHLKSKTDREAIDQEIKKERAKPLRPRTSADIIAEARAARMPNPYR